MDDDIAMSGALQGSLLAGNVRRGVIVAGFVHKIYLILIFISPTTRIPLMAKRKAEQNEADQDSTPATKSKKPRPPKITLESDPNISTDYDKICGLLSQKKTWRSVQF